jgi:hypothetical protein
MIRRVARREQAGEPNAMQTSPDADRENVQQGKLDSILLRIVAWGAAAALAMAVAVFTAQTQAGTERIQVALSGELEPPPAVIAATQPPDPQIAILQAKLERLSADRERLENRLASLEQGLDDVTGSIRSQSEKREATPQIAKSPPIIEPPLIPRLETLTLTPKASAPKPEAAAPRAEPEIANTQVAAEPKPSEAAPQAETEVTVPPTRVAGLPPAAKRAAEFGIELGNAPDMGALQNRWLGIKANYGPLLTGLSPVAVKDKRPGSTSLRLIAGPVKSMAAARELCAKFAVQNGYCFPRQVDPAEIVQR